MCHRTFISWRMAKNSSIWRNQFRGRPSKLWNPQNLVPLKVTFCESMLGFFAKINFRKWSLKSRICEDLSLGQFVCASRIFWEKTFYFDTKKLHVFLLFPFPLNNRLYNKKNSFYAAEFFTIKSFWRPAFEN